MADFNYYFKIEILQLLPAEYGGLEICSFSMKNTHSHHQSLEHRDMGTQKILAITELMCFWVSLTRFTSGRSGIGVPLPILSLYLIYKGTDIAKSKRIYMKTQLTRVTSYRMKKDLGHFTNSFKLQVLNMF